MSRPLVLNTRPREASAALSRLLLARGFDPLECPCVATVPAWRAADLAEVGQRLRAGGYAWTVVASATAAACLLDALEATGGGTADLARTRVLCGPGTAEALAERGVSAARVLPRFSAAAALDALVAERPTSVLAAGAEGGRDDLVVGLRQRGTRVDVPRLYRAEPTPPPNLAEVRAALERRAVAAVAFASPSAVHGLLAGLGNPGPLRGVALAAIGDTTEAALRAAGLRADAVAERTTLESLADAVVAALRASPVTTA